MNKKQICAFASARIMATLEAYRQDIGRFAIASAVVENNGAPGNKRFQIYIPVPGNYKNAKTRTWGDVWRLTAYTSRIPNQNVRAVFQAHWIGHQALAEVFFTFRIEECDYPSGRVRRVPFQLVPKYRGLRSDRAEVNEALNSFFDELLDSSAWDVLVATIQGRLPPHLSIEKKRRRIITRKVLED